MKNIDRFWIWGMLLAIWDINRYAQNGNDFTMILAYFFMFSSLTIWVVATIRNSK